MKNEKNDKWRCLAPVIGHFSLFMVCPKDAGSVYLRSEPTGGSVKEALSDRPGQRPHASRNNPARTRSGPDVWLPTLDADLVVLAADPAQDARAFVNVRYTFRRGRMIYGNL